MISIQLTQGKTALIDDEDAGLARLQWFTLHCRRSLYAARNTPTVNGRRTIEYLHRTVWARAHPGEPVPPELDHRDGDGLNCRRGNLRDTTRENAARAYDNAARELHGEFATLNFPVDGERGAA